MTQTVFEGRGPLLQVVNFALDFGQLLDHFGIEVLVDLQDLQPGFIDLQP